MKHEDSYKGKARCFALVLLPVLITQVALVSTGFFDTVMSGRVSEYDLAGVAVGANMFFPVFGAMIGVMLGVTPIIAQFYGADRRQEISPVVVQGMYLAAVLALLMIGTGFLLVPPLLVYMELEPQVERIAAGYLQAVACGLCPLLVGSVLRNFIDALGYTRVTMLITMLSVPFNVLMNYLFMYGYAGLPALGGVGAGVGSALTYWFVLLLNIIVVMRVKPFAGYEVFRKLTRPSLTAWKEYLQLGIPIGTAMFCEQSIFGAVGLLMAVYGTEIIAAHQAALNFTTMVYMVPLSVSMSMTILVGFELGGRRYADARRYSYMGIAFSLLFSGTLALILVNFRGFVAELYSNEKNVQQLIEGFLALAIFLQFSDAVSAPLQGILRGYKDVKAALLLAVVSFWAVGLPFGWFYAERIGIGPHGYWLGLITGVAVGAVLLGLRLAVVQKRIQQMKGGI